MTAKEWGAAMRDDPFIGPVIGMEGGLLSMMRRDLAACEAERDKYHDLVNEYRPAWERETIRADAAEAELARLREKVADIEEGALHASYSLTDEERKKWDAVKAYEDTAQELHECQTERDRLREQLRLSNIDAANNEAEANELRPFAIGGDGSTHWYWKDEAERLAKELADERKGRE
jgi:chromosome segregation ATPase